MTWPILLGGLLACDGPTETPKRPTTDQPDSGGTPPTEVPTDTSASTAGPCPPDSPYTWENAGEGLTRTWCTPCHSSLLPEDKRQGAPVGIDFDTLAASQVWAGAAWAAVAAEPQRMPPAGGLSPVDQAILTEWLACGAPGEPTTVPPDACSTLVHHPGDVVLQDGDDLCRKWNAVEGSLTVAPGAVVDLDCLCEVTGDLALNAAVSLANLAEVGGTLFVNAPDVTAPKLERVRGDLRPMLATVDLPALREVDGSILGTKERVERLRLRELERVGGDIRLDQTANLAELDTARLTEVGGSVLLHHCPALLSWTTSSSIELVGGDFSLEGTGLSGDLTLLGRGFSIGGDLRVVSNPRLLVVGGLHELSSIGGTLEVSQNPILRELVGLGRLRTLGHLRLTDNDELVRVRGLNALETVDTLTFQRNRSVTELPEFSQLQQVGAVDLSDNGALSSFALAPVAVSFAGDLVVARNRGLSQVLLPPEAAWVAYRFEDLPNLQQLQWAPQRSVSEITLRNLPLLANPLEWSELRQTNNLLLQDLPALSGADLSGLAEVSLDFTLERAGVRGVQLANLVRVGGTLRLVDLATMEDLNLKPRLTVGGDLYWQDLPALPTDQLDELLAAGLVVKGTVYR